ncbi:signal recognition particle, SRP9/SRP14 subunit [Gautieria morchelliformis]|nr:signal recognition particle, SRP9/SRP14 subunit [Gautieria morchelliformis]
MVYIINWQEFQEAAEGLYEKSPRNTRYCVKWRAAEGVLVLKITDNTTCLKYKTHSSIFLNRFETLNLSLMRRMQNRKAASPPPAATQPAAPELTSNTAGVGGATSAGSTVAPTAGGPVGGGVKKKKGKKKK